MKKIPLNKCGNIKMLTEMINERVVDVIPQKLHSNFTQMSANIGIRKFSWLLAEWKMTIRALQRTTLLQWK